MSPSFSVPSEAGNLQDAYELTQEIESREAVIREMEIEIGELTKIRDGILSDYESIDRFEEGRFSFQAIVSARRRLDVKALQKYYPEIWDLCKVTKESCTIAAVQEHLLPHQIDDLSDVTEKREYRVFYDWRKGVSDTVTCGFCGSEVEAGKFCPSCGFRADGIHISDADDSEVLV